ncbi:flagellar export protein FliJ [Candidatus Dependentiae bacterium]|nr:flagellar export protein FliJ [Candidatus Dependentiae bacterium]
MTKLFARKLVISVIGGIVVVCGFFVMKDRFGSCVTKIGYKIGKSLTEDTVVAREPWITIFVHGSFGSLLGFLSYSQVMDDRVDGTPYKKAVNKMRKDSFFYREQPLLGRGLVKVNPSFDLCATGSEKLAVYPLLKTYEEIVEHMYPGKEQNFFYTFGWSGLLSQRRRCLEAIRFYNMLSEELEKYRKDGMSPKIRVITHSHGGNVIAYAAAIDEALRFEGGVLKNKDKRRKAVQLVRERFKVLSVKKEAKERKGQKRWDYVPEGKLIGIDEFILWGMPVQPETDHLFTSALFKNVYHFYSDDDLVQRIDGFSTKKGYSDRRFDVERLCKMAGNHGKEKACRLVQSRIMVNRKVLGGDGIAESNDAVSPPEEKVAMKQESFWSVLFSGGALLTPTGQDPTHKELWFFSWKKDGDDVREFILAPFPAAIFSPVFVNLINQKPDLSDVDINIAKRDDRIEFELVKHDDLCLQDVCLIEKKFLLGITEKVEPWKPGKTSPQDVLNVVRGYADYL